MKPSLDLPDDLVRPVNIVECAHEARPDEEMTPERAADVLLGEEAEARKSAREGASHVLSRPRLELSVPNGYSSQMKRATLTETKNNLSALVDQVQHGETILILDRGRPVARLESVLGEGDDPEGRLARLERQGLLRRASAPLPQEILMSKPPRASGGVSALEALLAERRDGR
jgi:prevent-host-death family protein